MIKKTHIALALSFGLSLMLWAGCSLGKGRQGDTALKGTALPGGDRYVVVLSLDGFRADYQSKAHTPNIDKMDREGLSGSFRPCYPSLTFPNHYSMATGLHPNNHGLVGNQFWDEQGRMYKLGDRKSVEDPTFYYGDPLWNTASRQGVRTASYFWVGSETAIGGKQPDRWKRYDASVDYYDRADSVLTWLQLPEAERPHLIMWYLDEPDHTGHTYSPEAPETSKMIQRVDSVVGYFRDKLAALPIAKQVDFILVADHGMATFQKDKIVNLADYLPLDSFVHVATGPFTHLYPKAGYTDKAMEILKRVPHVKAYRKGDLPERFHFGSSPRIGEIVVMADLGANIFFRKGGLPKNLLAAGHGFDNQHADMLALFKATGPHFKAGQRIEKPMLNITLYPLVCQLLGIKPSAHDADEQLARSLHSAK